MPGDLVRIAPDVVSRLDEYKLLLNPRAYKPGDPRAYSRGDVVRLLMACATPHDVKEIVMEAMKKRLAEIAETATDVSRQLLPEGRMYVVHPDGYVVRPNGNRERINVFPGVGRTEKAARVDLYGHLLDAYLDNGESE